MSKFTHEEQIRLMNACGIPIGGTFDFQLLDGKMHFELKLTETSLQAVTDNEDDRRFLNSILTLWQLQAFANLHRLGSFSRPTPLSELQQVANEVERLTNPIYNTMPIEELVPKVEGEFRDFWASFNKATPATIDAGTF
jgi:hypothetical protein